MYHTKHEMTRKGYKTVLISEEAYQILVKLAEQNNTSIRKMTDKIVKTYAEKLKQEME